MNARTESTEEVLARLIIEADTAPVCEVSLVDAMEFRRKQYGLSAVQWCKVLHMNPTHYSDFVHGRRKLTRLAMRRAVAVGVPADVMLNLEGKE